MAVLSIGFWHGQDCNGVDKFGDGEVWSVGEGVQKAMFVIKWWAREQELVRMHVWWC